MALGGALGLGLGARDAAAFCVAGAAQTHIHLRLCGRRGTNSHLPSFCVAGVAQMALRGALGLGLGARDAATFCVAGAAQTHIYRRFAWQAWHKLTSTVVLRGRCGRLDLVWARVAPRHFAWQARHKLTSTIVLHGRRGTNSHVPSFCVAGAAWQAWHKLTSTVVLRGRRGTDGTAWRAWTWFGRA